MDDHSDNFAIVFAAMGVSKLLCYKLYCNFKVRVSVLPANVQTMYMWHNRTLLNINKKCHVTTDVFHGT